MITDCDIEKLKKVFVTKKELKEESAHIIQAVFDMIGKAFERIDETNMRIDKTNEKIDETNERINKMLFMLDQTNKNLSNAIAEIRTHRILLTNHESRLETIEYHQKTV